MLRGSRSSPPRRNMKNGYTNSQWAAWLLMALMLAGVFGLTWVVAHRVDRLISPPMRSTPK
jgi:hypothetical protein